MKTVVSSGFTIIEVMLFFAVSGALAVAILAGSGAKISQQRYLDSVRSLQANIQQQYGEANNTINTRPDAAACNAATAEVTTEEGDASGLPVRGASECVLLGRFMQFYDNGKKIATASVVGYKPSSLPEPADDLEAFQQYKLARSSIDSSSDRLQWEASIQKPDNQSVTSRILILRSPISGSMRTFISDSSPFNPETNYPIPTSAVNAYNAKTVFCVNPSDFLVGERVGVIINESASGPSAVEQMAAGSGC